jgi:hypothetical protein
MPTNLFSGSQDHISSIKDALSIIESTWETAQKREPKIKLQPFLYQTKTTDKQTAETKSKVHFSWKGHIQEYDKRNDRWLWSNNNIWGGSGHLYVGDGKLKYKITSPNVISTQHHSMGETKDNAGNSFHNFGVTHNIPETNVSVTYPAHFMARINDYEIDGRPLVGDRKDRNMNSATQINDMITRAHEVLKTKKPEHNSFFLYTKKTNTYIPTTMTSKNGTVNYKLHSVWPSIDKRDTRPVVPID